MIRRYTLSLFLIQATAEAFAPHPALFVGGRGASAMSRHQQHQQQLEATTTPDCALDHLLFTTTTTTIADVDGPDAISAIGDSILIYPLGVVAVSLLLYGLTFVAEKIMVPEEEMTTTSTASTTNNKVSTTTSTTSEKDDADEKPPVVVDTVTVDAADSWSD